MAMTMKDVCNMMSNPHQIPCCRLGLQHGGHDLTERTFEATSIYYLSVFAPAARQQLLGVRMRPHHAVPYSSQ